MGDLGVVENLVLRRLRSPLTVPYKLAFGPVEAFDTVLVEVHLVDGRTGWGEATMLTGYTEETIEQAWGRATLIAEKLSGVGVAEAKTVAMRHLLESPFTTTAFVTALEMAEGHDLLANEKDRRAQLLAIVNATEHDAISQEIEARISEGYVMLKVKVGFDLFADRQRLALIQELVAGRAVLRVDANQGYSQADGVAFVSGIDPTGIELVEQTCSAGDWPAAKAVAEAARANGVTVMLDESIYGLSDVDCAADLACADVIKLKLMKMGGLNALVAGLRHVRARGMRSVLGNGVAGDIGCWMEACVAATHLDNAGEMNGFLKPVTQLFDLPMHIDGGDLILTGEGEVAPNWPAIEDYTLEKRECC